MKKVIVVSKTHLDLGFTDFAENIRTAYLERFIPGAIEIAEKAEKSGGKYVWTTGSWILKEALEKGTSENRKKLFDALKKGYIAPHAMPLTTHTELLDYDTLDYGLSIVEKLDKISGRKTTAAKLTDVPGHTAALIPLLAKHGVKLLHIGVNGASAMPDVPECFLWRYKESEVVVIYSGGYGGEFKCDLTEEILYLDHSFDNYGPKSGAIVKRNMSKIKQKYPGYEVSAGRLDDYADVIWEVRGELPVVTAEIGDTWIHGAATDPYKAAATRALIRLKNKWLESGSLDRESEAYINLADNILCLGEHTCGMDIKRHLGDFGCYLKQDFEKARASGVVKRKPGSALKDFPVMLVQAFLEMTGSYNKGSYTAVEKSWAEQRLYAEKAISLLPDDLKNEAKAQLEMLIPKDKPAISDFFEYSGENLAFGKWNFFVNKFGGLSGLKCGGKEVFVVNDKPVLSYNSYGKKDYDFWLENYTRDIKKTWTWALGDFARPCIKYVDDKFPKGEFPYRADKIWIKKEAAALTVAADLVVEEKAWQELGAPKSARVMYKIKDGGVSVEVLWFEKSANRLTESTMLRFYPAADTRDVSYVKISEEISPSTIVKNGSRNLAAVERVMINKKDKSSAEKDGAATNGGHSGQCFEIVNLDAPLVSPGKGKILQFDNVLESVKKDGLAYILHDNVWGTNFPLWYEDNARFRFEINPLENI